MPEYIEKSKVVSILIDVENHANRDEWHYRKSGEHLYHELCEAEIRIGKMEPENVAPVVHGRWMKIKPVHYQCSICGINTGGFTSNYCPHCGAKMDFVAQDDRNYVDEQKIRKDIEEYKKELDLSCKEYNDKQIEKLKAKCKKLEEEFKQLEKEQSK